MHYHVIYSRNLGACMCYNVCGFIYVYLIFELFCKAIALFFYADYFP